MEKLELKDFYNDGFGWICKACKRELQAQENKTWEVSRLMREGEAETKTPQLSNSAMAKWADAAHRTLLCPRCGITELADKL